MRNIIRSSFKTTLYNTILFNKIKKKNYTVYSLWEFIILVLRMIEIKCKFRINDYWKDAILNIFVKFLRHEFIEIFEIDEHLVKLSHDLFGKVKRRPYVMIFILEVTYLHEWNHNMSKTRSAKVYPIRVEDLFRNICLQLV